jgi:RND family efflux transporter MFP subunit
MKKWIVVVFIALAGCGSKREAPAKAEAAGPVVSVKLVDVVETEWPSFHEAVGTVRARASGQVSARVMAYVREVRVRLGDRVKAGQVLVVLDGRETQTRQRQAEAARTEARTTAIEAEQSIASARAAMRLAEVTYKRMKDLHDKASVSNQEFDEASARLEMARAAVEMAESRRRSVDAKIAQADEEVKGVEVQAGYSAVTAPFGGVVTEKPVEPGNLAVPGMTLMTIERDGGFRLEAQVEERNLSTVRLGQRVMVVLDSIEGPLEGTVSEIVPAVDPISRAFIAKVDLPASTRIRSGMFGRARFIAGSRRVIAAPAAAVVNRGQMQWVFVNDGGKARGRIVTLGASHDGAVDLLSGARAGEKVIAPAPGDIADGTRIEVQP